MTTSISYKRSLQIAALQELSAEGYIPVHWRLDMSDKQGIVYVRVPPSFNEQRVIAELCALNYLMKGPKPVFGNARAPATAVTKVTSGAIRKAFRQETDKGEIVPFARFLFSCFCESTLETDKSIGWTASLPVVEMTRIEAAPTSFEQFPLAALAAPVGVARHAVERYQERVGTSCATNSLTSLRRLMADAKNTRVASISDYKRDAGLLKYGKEARLFVHHPSRTTLVVLPEDDGWVLVTVYYENLPTKEAVYVGGRIEMRNRA